MIPGIAYDSHCHLEYIKTLAKHLTPSIIPGVTLADVADLIILRQQFPIYKIGYGLHPWYIPEFKNRIDTIVNLPKVLHNLVQEEVPDFIGEIGLDKFRPHFELQTEVFITQLLIAQKFNLPVVIHCVKAYNEVLALLKKYNIKRGIIHGFNANEVVAREFYTQGFLLGIGSHITKNSLITKGIQDIPLEFIVLESDAPYMPAFGKLASSSDDCFLYGQILARLLNINLIEVINQSNQNIVNLFL